MLDVPHNVDICSIRSCLPQQVVLCDVIVAISRLQ
jgi:hypothetical protein